MGFWDIGCTRSKRRKKTIKRKPSKSKRITSTGKGKGKGKGKRRTSTGKGKGKRRTSTGKGKKRTSKGKGKGKGKGKKRTSRKKRSSSMARRFGRSVNTAGMMGNYSPALMNTFQEYTGMGTDQMNAHVNAIQANSRDMFYV